MKKVMNKQHFEVLARTTLNYTIREDTMDGKKHLVVPVVMMVEGVHCGSQGPILHVAEELAKWTEAWDGIPVTVSHPKKGKANVSANSPDVLDSSSVGRIFNTHYDNGLKAEAWIDYEKISDKSEEALEAIENGDPLEVSVGVFNDSEIAEEGAQWNGEPYDVIAHNYRPDHLALLPGEQGACSWGDGCGIRTNKKGGVIVKELQKTFQQLSKKGYVVSLLNNEMGFNEIREALQSKISALNQTDVYHYIQDVYEDHVIYSRWGDGEAETLFRQGYSMDDNENIELEGLAVEVKKKVEYVAYNKMRRAKPVINTINKGGKMNTNASLCDEAKVDALIANERTHWMPSDREWLLTQKATVIAKMSPMESKKAEEDPAALQANKDEAVSAFKESLKEVGDYTALMPKAMKAQVEGGVKLYTEHREALVKSILDNTAKDLWKEDALKAMDDETLENLSKSIKLPADYSGMSAGGGQQSTTGEQVEIPVEYAKRKEDK